MKYKTLGDSGLLVSTLCLGTMTFNGGEGFWKAIGTVDQTGADEIIKASIEAGINFFDTADVYSEGESEKTLGQSLKNLNIARKDVVLATKVYGRVGPGRNDVGASRGHIMDAVEGFGWNPSSGQLFWSDETFSVFWLRPKRNSELGFGFPARSP